MFEFGRAPIACERCGPSHALVRDTATLHCWVNCDSCGTPVGTVASLSKKLPPVAVELFEMGDSLAVTDWH